MNGPEKRSGKPLGGGERGCGWSAGVLIAVLTIFGCASTPMPPSEATVAALRNNHDEMVRLVASGQLSPEQARDQYYSKLGSVDPPLPGLDALIEYRRQLKDQIASGQFAPGQAAAQLSAREGEMLARWEEMAARYAAEQRRLQKLQSEHERGFRLEQMPVVGKPEPVLPR